MRRIKQVPLLSTLLLSIPCHAVVFYFGAGGDYFQYTQQDLATSIQSFNEALFKSNASVDHQYRYGGHVTFGFQGELILPNFRFDLSASHNRQDLTHPHAKSHVSFTTIQLHTHAYLFPWSTTINPFILIGAGGLFGRGTYLQDSADTVEPERLTFSGPGFVITGLLGFSWLVISSLSIELAGGYRYGLVPLVYANDVPEALFPNITSGEVLQLKTSGKNAKEFNLEASGLVVTLSLHLHL